MEVENKENRPGILEVAKKKRHLHLLEKLHSGKSLSPTEIEELRKYEEGPLSVGIVDTQEKVAKAFDVGVRTVQRWVRDGMPETPDGLFNLTDIQAWRLTKKKPGRRSEDDEKSRWEAKLKEIKFKQAEQEFKKQQGELISRAEVEQGWAERVIAVKTAFLGLPRRVALQLVGLEAREIEAALSEAIKDVIELNFIREKPKRKKKK